MDELIYSSATYIVQAIRNKKVSAQEVVEMFLRRIEEVNPKLNAVVQIAGDRALAEARKADEDQARGSNKGPLHGLPFTIKDSVETEGVISTAGTKGREFFVPKADATVVARLRSAGAILLGKSNTPELTLVGETDNLIYGRTNNPYDLSRIPGASSGGSAAIIASGGSPLDFGSDTAGSIRLPSHYCGIAGIKPTSGRVPRTGHLPSYGMGAIDSLTQIGPMARFVEDLALALPIIAGPDWKDPAIVPMPLGDFKTVAIKGLRIATYTENGLMDATAEIVDAVKSARIALADAGAIIEETNRPDVLRAGNELGNKLRDGDGRAWIRRMLKKAGTTEVYPWLENSIKKAQPCSVEEFSALMEDLDSFRSTMLSFMENYDAILCPVSAITAGLHGSIIGQNTSVAITNRGYNFTGVYNLTGWPAAVVRGGTSPEGLPIGVQIIGRPWHEEVALAVAHYLEKSLGGWQRPPL